MKQLLAIAFITLLALGMGCAWISPSSDATSEGIKVHGDWTVTITNPDGTLDAVHEFDNALTTEGSFFLISRLMGQYKNYKWRHQPGDDPNQLENTQVPITGYIIYGEEEADIFGIEDWKCSGYSGDANNMSQYGFPWANVTQIIEGQFGPHKSALRLESVCDVEIKFIGSTQTNMAEVCVVVTLADQIKVAAYGDHSKGNYFCLTRHEFEQPIVIMQGQKIAFTVEISFS